MEILIIVVVAVVLGGLIYIRHNKATLDTNKDGKVDAAEMKQAVKAEVKVVTNKVSTKAKAVKEKVTAKKTAKK